MTRKEQDKRRSRMVAAVARGDSVNKVAERFNVSRDLVYKAVRRERDK